MISRREFVRFGAATLAVTPAALMAVDAAGGVYRADGERLRIGILSDIHLKVKADKAKFVRALRAFRDKRVDGVLICGDLADNGVVPQLQYVADAWESVFPHSQGADGSHVERIFLCGDHDTGGYAHRVSFFKNGTWLMKHYKCTEAELNAMSLSKCCKKEWQRIFGEPWSPIVHKRVKGYDFVLSHFTRKGWNSALGLDAFLKDFKPDPSKPFFYAQHRVLRDTACGPNVWGQDDGSAKKLLSAYPNCCAFFGHSHQTAVREDAIWQGAFTAVQVPSLKYVTHEPYHANKPNGYKAEQGLMLSVYDDKMVVCRLDFASGKPLATAWKIPLIGGERPFVHERRRAAAVVPEFPKGAKLAAKLCEIEGKKGAKGKGLELTFPSVTGLHGGVRAYDYLVSVTINAESREKSRKIEKRFFSPKCYRSPEADAEDVNVQFPLDDVAEWKSLHVSVRPREIFGGLGASLEMDVNDDAEGTALVGSQQSVPNSTRGTFVQRKILADVDVTLVSKGEFRFEKGRFFEWKVLSPVPSLFLATPTNWTTTVRGRTSVHPLNVDVSSFSKVFEIKEMKEHVKSVETKPENGFPERVKVNFKNGDRLEIELVQSC